MCAYLEFAAQVLVDLLVAVELQSRVDYAVVANVDNPAVHGVFPLLVLPGPDQCAATVLAALEFVLLFLRLDDDSDPPMRVGLADLNRVYDHLLDRFPRKNSLPPPPVTPDPES